MTTKRGLASPPVHSALATTRRWRLQLSRVDQVKSLKRRAGLPVRLALLRGGGEFGRDLGDQPRVLGQAEQEIDAVVLAPGHQRLAGKPRIGAQQDAHRGPALRGCWATMRAISSTLPALASMLAGRSLAANRCRPQNT